MLRRGLLAMTEEKSARTVIARNESASDAAISICVICGQPFRSWLWRTLFICGVTFSSCDVWADNGILRDGIGARLIGRGGTTAAYGDGGSSAFFNPALLDDLDSHRLEIGYDQLLGNTRFENSLGSDSAKYQDASLPWGTLVFNPPGRWTFSGAIYPVGGLGNDLDVVDPLFGRQRTSSNMVFIRGHLSASFAVTERFSLGAAVMPTYSSIKTRFPYTFSGGPLRGISLLTRADLDGWGIGYALGARYRLSDRFSIGAAYTSETHFDMDGKMSLGAPFDIGKYDLEAKNMQLPRTLVIGFMGAPFERVRVLGDVYWINWGRSLDGLRLDFDNPTNPVLAAIPGLADFNERVPFKWRDTYQVRVGIEWDATERWTFRAGFTSGSDPIPSRTLIPPLAGLFEKAVSAGFTYRRTDWEISSAIQYSLANQKSTRENLLGRVYESSTNRLEALLISVEVAYKF